MNSCPMEAGNENLPKSCPGKSHERIGIEDRQKNAGHPALPVRTQRALQMLLVRRSVCGAAALTGPVTPDVPASVLQLHPDCEFILDPPAAECLP
jgi:hypothetical protein